ncbi:hypothetical protein BGW36DRAFT_372839 [Talaromyces proteolyticus]|uniref:5'-3' DNA helicase ZGRF1-like N-terminal domain-containing protein n=1 Tax=Talaromyces proteolyticus TaxID=1131652 RepID=A0AAD4Q465_9EURO|nr:uncharacterized protein BGW36DRAFT_372839 [Talaromyces proteolyticus]KAH8702426.1 hypothetical protein BGW36DRAFT_372839 [Talaromyces proteolyticus]
MSRPPLSLPRGTTSSVPASQNTAPVIKFRCLYTHDVRRKAKRWQDGYLKFHTFNKRAMVYDDAGNFIGDHHWRDSNEIQDGDELELDKGVLIQVSECMERTQADISALFEKRKASQESPQQSTPLAPPSTLPLSSRTAVPARTGPPRSLNDLLGIKRPSTGRVAAIQSPYEQRHPTKTNHKPQEQEERPRPAKRSKQSPPVVSEEKGSQRQIRGFPEIIELGNSTSQTHLTGTILTEPVVSSEPRQPDKRHNSSHVSANATSRPRSNDHVAKAQKQVNSPVPARDLARNQSKSILGEAPLRTPLSLEKTEVQVAKSRLETNKPQTRLNPLRMSIEKPRPKLMYKAHTSKASNNRTVESAQAGSNPFVSGTLLPGSHTDCDISASTLAVLEEINEEESFGNTREENALMPDSILSKKETSQSTRTRALYRVPSHTAIHGSAASSAGIELKDDLNPPTSLQIHIQQRDSGPTHTKHNITRSHSDLSSMLLESHPMVSDPMVGISEPSVAEKQGFARRRKEPKAFRKSYSDTTALWNELNHNHGPSLPVATERPPISESNHEDSEKGPWTAEALDFFDWWPPGRQKP